MAGEATSIILSANSANWSRLPAVGVEASIILTLFGRRCRKSSLTKVLSVAMVRSPKSC